MLIHTITSRVIHSTLGMGTETRYLIGLGAKLLKTGVSISSDVNGSAIGTGEIKKTHIHLLLLYTHYLENSIPPESPAVFMSNNIQTFVYDAFLLFAIQKSEITHVDEFQHAQHESPVYDRRELIIKTCLHFRPVAVILN